MSFKPTRIKSKKLLQGARGEECTMNVADFCNYNPETVVAMHINVEGGKMGGKTDDTSTVYGCSDCHTWLDQNKGSELDQLFYTRRALVRTTNRRFEQGLYV